MISQCAKAAATPLIQSRHLIAPAQIIMCLVSICFVVFLYPAFIQTNRVVSCHEAWIIIILTVDRDSVGVLTTNKTCVSCPMGQVSIPSISRYQCQSCPDPATQTFDANNVCQCATGYVSVRPTLLTLLFVTLSFFLLLFSASSSFSCYIFFVLPLSSHVIYYFFLPIFHTQRMAQAGAKCVTTAQFNAFTAYPVSTAQMVQYRDLKKIDR